MATDSTELTFVRCPSCRSLVPAVSTRCRMCGAAIDTGDEMASAEDDQRAAGDEDFADDVDPLGDYLEDLGASDEDDSDGDDELGDPLEDPLMQLNGSHDEPEEEAVVEEAPVKKTHTQAKKTTAKKKTTTKRRAKAEEEIEDETSEEIEMSTNEIDDPLRDAPSPNAVKQVDTDGRLYGWLVNYRDPKGEAVELREGKFFVTGESLKPNDLVIDEPSVSTPHALVSVSLDRGFRVQDLMSDSGVFVRGADEASYRQEEETVTLEHGDWLRFGDQEFLVTLVPQRIV